MKENVSLFLKKIEKIVGKENIKTGADAAALARDSVCTTTPPAALVYPSSTAEVSKLVVAAAEFSVPIWPYSTGKNWGYCNSTGQADSVVVILKNMNRILNVDYELAYAEIEPGVTYEQLNSYLRKNRIKLWTDCTGGPPKGSVIGNALDRGLGVTPYGDHFANLCGLEVVLPNGKIIRTGGFPNGKEGAWHTYKWGVGPSLEGLFAQSNFGIVTRAGIWLMREPDDFIVGAVKLQDNQLAESMDALREMMFAGVIPDKARFSNDIAALTLLTQAFQENLKPNTAISPAERARLRDKYCVPAWAMTFGIYGLKPMVELMRGEAGRRLSKYGETLFINKGKARLIERLCRSIEPLHNRFASATDWILKAFFGTSLPVMKMTRELIDLHKGIPNESVVRRAYFRHQSPRPTQNINVPEDQVGVYWFVPLIPFRGAEVKAFVRDTERHFETHGFDHYVTIIPLNVRTAVPLMLIVYDLKDKDSCRRAKALYETLYDAALSRGYQQFRCSHTGWDKVLSESPELKKVYELLKDTLDPKHVIAPGRFGIK